MRSHKRKLDFSEDIGSGSERGDNYNKYIGDVLVHASICDHVFLVPSPNLHDCSLNPSSISYLVNPTWSMQIGVHEILVGACKYW